MQHLLNEHINNEKFNILKMEVRNCDKFLMKTFLLISCIKILLIPTYHSTDFEVHRNWLAITHSLPINEWYTSDKSQWTLDYPPLFAWFEFVLSKLAVFFDPKMLNIENINYMSIKTKLFQRCSVICTDLIFVYGIREAAQTFCISNKNFMALVLLSLCNIGLLIIDHIHFQYNGFLIGILIISIAKTSKVSNENQILQGAVWFAVLLNLKHIYVYVAPAYIIWLLRSYCLHDDKFVIRFLKLGIIVLFVFLLSFGPFINNITQVLSRLFPFKRGLIHAYWAANIWALYAGTDKLLSVLWKKFRWLYNIQIASMTGGLVQEDSFMILPTPTPFFTFILTSLLMIPALWSLFFNKNNFNNPRKFVKCIILCGLTSFMCGWHVHEKAILTIIIPLCILASSDIFDAKIFIILSSAGHTALFPLLYPPEFIPLKLIVWFTYLIISVILFKKQFHCILLHSYELFYIGFLPVITIYETLIHKILFKDQLPFLSLALTSIYCALGIGYCYVIYYHEYLFEKNNFLMKGLIEYKSEREKESNIS